MVGKFILRGLIVGIIAGLLTFGYAKVYGEPNVAVAIQLEDKHAEQERAEAIAKGQKPEAEEPEMFSRDIQTGVGLLTGTVAVGAGLGALFGVLFAFAYGRLGNLGPKATAGLVGLIGLVTVYVVPALKYPANPPTVGLPETIKLRTGLYFLMIGLSILATLGGLFLRGRLIPKFGAWTASVIAAIVYIVVLFVIFALLPYINEVPSDFPAPTLWNFRVASLGMQTILWGVTAILFGYLNGLPKQES
jgi:hypothetical protein